MVKINAFQKLFVNLLYSCMYCLTFAIATQKTEGTKSMKMTKLFFFLINTDSEKRIMQCKKLKTLILNATYLKIIRSVFIKMRFMYNLYNL